MITLTTYKWVPDFAAPLMRAFRVRWALEEAGFSYRVRAVALGPEQRSFYAPGVRPSLYAFSLPEMLSIYRTGSMRATIPHGFLYAIQLQCTRHPLALLAR
jgi:hypothetical protein